MPSIEWTGYSPYQLSNDDDGFYLAPKLAPQFDQPTVCQAIVLLFLRIHRVRHRFLLR